VLDLVLYGLSAAFALLTALTASLPPHRPWGAIAAVGFAILITAITRRARVAVTLLTWGTTALLPLVVEAAQRAAGRTDRAQEEVIVVEHAGARLVHTGTPYLGHDAIAALPADERLLGYFPYQPGMALFGVPRALAGTHWWTDARVWFAVVTGAVLALAIRQLPQTPWRIRALQVATVLPVCALTLAVGGDDLPVLALCLLALAYAGRDRFAAAGVAVGVAGALKLFAWPVALVLVALAIHRKRGGVLAAGALGIPMLTLIPAFLVDRGAAVENVVRFPLGKGLVRSPAASPFPGHLIAAGLPGGNVIAAALLLAAGAALAVWLVRHPPENAAGAANVCAVGLLTATLLMPATRFGYLLYPAAYAVWAPALRPVPATPRAAPLSSTR
jgi:glycosyl transferase family 87